MIKYQTIILAAVLLLPLVLCCGDPNCKSCPTNTNVCESCKIGYYLNNTCSPCSSKVNLCSACAYNESSATVACTKCANRYAVNTSSNTCEYCDNALPFCDKCELNGNNFVCKEC